MLIGYARVSTLDQDLRMQIEALESAGCDRIFSDQASGGTANRPGLQEALAFARPGDCIIVWKLDRLGRSVKQLISLAEELEKAGVELRSVTDGIDTKGAAGRFFFNVMAALAEMERELIRERTRAGLESARRAGRIGGRKLVMDAKKLAAATKLLKAGDAPKDVAQAIGVSIATLYRHLPAGKPKSEA